MATMRTRCAECGEPDDSEDETDDVHQMNNSVYFYADVTRRNVWRLIESMERANAWAVRDAYRPAECAYIYLYIQSNGGDAHAGLSAMDHIRNNRISVVTVADGFVASAATFMLLGGSYRVAMSHATVLVHELSLTLFQGKHSDLMAEANNSSRLMGLVKRVYTEYTSLDAAGLDKLLCADTTMTSSDCIRNGFVEEVW